MVQAIQVLRFHLLELEKVRKNNFVVRFFSSALNKLTLVEFLHAHFHSLLLSSEENNIIINIF